MTLAPWEHPHACFGHCDPEGWAAPCRTETVDEALVPLETIRVRFGISRATLHRWLTADGIATHPIPGRQAHAVRWGDIVRASRDTTHWQVPASG